MVNDIENDIYLKLINDLMDNPLDDKQINIPILQDIQHKANCIAYEINENLSKSCAELSDALKTSALDVGAKKGYIEPCPVGYTGSVINGKDKFRTIFLGLNPHLEPPRPFHPSTTYSDLANFHHPHDILHGKNPLRYEKNKEIGNNFFRVLGNMEGKTGKSAWSPFFKPVIRTHLALLKENINIKDINTWEDVLNIKKSLPELTDYLIDLLKQYPFAHIEMIPFKSTQYKMDNFTKLLDKENKTPLHFKYKKYIKDIFEFIDRYATSDAYIIIPTNLSENDIICKVYDVVKEQIIDLDNDYSCKGDYFFYIKETNEFISKAPNAKRIPKKTSPMYLAKWTKGNTINRKIIITASVSGHGDYNWIYTDFKKGGWINSIKKYFE